MIYTGLNNAGEVDNVYLSKRLTFSGAPPLSFPSKGYDLEDFLISGNTVQDGTPTPEAPVDVVGCGVKTGNLVDPSTIILNSNISSLGRVESDANYDVGCFQIIQGNTYTIDSYVYAFYYANPGIGSRAYDNRRVVETPGIPSSFTAPITGYCCFRVAHGDSFMANNGSAALPYEQYGYKLPITINGTEYPIYLGQVETTRKIKKLVLTGTENVDLNTVDKNRLIIQAVYTLPQTGTTTATNIICSHLKTLSTAAATAAEQGITMRNNGTDILFGIPFSLIGATTEDSSSTIRAKVKSYLASQYAAGTPVTVWYVLAESETGIVNEPLMKIGDYADTVTMAQSGITIPTTKGENTLTVPTAVLPSSVSITTPSIEVSEVYGDINYQKPIYYKKRTLIGVPPLTYKALSNPLSDYLISGNTLQDGTPTPEAPVDVVGCGVRTGNLLEITDDIKTSTKWKLSPPLVEGKRFFEVYDITNAVPRGIISANVFENFEPGYEPGLLVCAITPENTSTVDKEYRILTNNGVITSKTFDTTSWNNVYLCIGYGNGFDSESTKQQKIDELFNNWRITIIESSTPPAHYIPYGFKLPLTVNGTEYPIYLGQVQTTRKIKKLVLTGEEGWTITSNGVLRIGLSGQLRPSTPLCTHYLGSNSTAWANVPDKSVTVSISGYLAILDTTYTAVADFKSYLAAQYDASTPVTVWYVLAETETGIVNEPLMKIGDYADTISMAQAGVTIPTVSGSNGLDMTSTVKPSAVSITGNIKPTGYGQLLDVNNVEIYDKSGTPIFIQG